MATVGEVFKRLSGVYKSKVWWDGMSPTDILVATILSQNTTDKNSIRAYKALKRRYSSWDELISAPEEEISGVIHSGGLPNVKAKRIKQTLSGIKKQTGSTDISFLHEMDKKEAEKVLTSLHGVGPKTAAVVLSLSFGKETIPVDTHVHRVANRLGLVSEKTPAKTQAVLEEIVPDSIKLDLHHLLIEHGREICKSQKPECGQCVLNRLCNYHITSHQR